MTCTRTYLPRACIAAALLGAVFASTSTAGAQVTTERTALLSGGWIAAPGVLEVELRPLFGRRFDNSVIASPGVSVGFGALPRVMVGGDFAVQTMTFRRERPDWQVLGRFLMASDDQTAVALTGAYNGAAGSIDGELSGAQWIGPVRLIGVVRGFTDAFDTGESRGAAGLGVVLHPFAGRMPFAIAGDIITMAPRREGEDPAWSAAGHAGLFRSRHTASVYVTNGTSGTLQGRTLGASGTRVGFELTFRVPMGRALGLYAPETVLPGSVRETQAAPGVQLDIRNFLFVQRTVEMAAGATVQWTNEDNVSHSVRGEDGLWGSGDIRPGRSWAVTLDRPGRYPYRCGHHGYMRGVLIVQ